MRLCAGLGAGPAFTYPRDRLFVTLENHKSLHAKDPIRSLRNLPPYDPIDRWREEYEDNDLPLLEVTEAETRP